MSSLARAQLPRTRWRCAAQAILFLILLPWHSLSAATAVPIDASTYPREFNSAVGKARVHHPAISGWNDFRRLTGRTPIEIRTASGESWVGSTLFEVDTEIHFTDRTVSLQKPQISGWVFEQGTPPAQVLRLANDALKSGSDKVSLDYLLRVLPADFEIPDQARSRPQLNSDPPRIVISNKPRRLMLIDGPPSYQSIDGTGLEFVVNTDWDIFHHKDSDQWFVLSDGHWESNNMLSSGDWNNTTKLPQDFLNLEYNPGWPQVVAAMPPRLPDTPPVPFTISYEPTELIQIDGQAQLQEIPGTVLRYVKNTDSDLFLLADRYYILLSGRWFMTKNLKRKWSTVKQLPAAFREIPTDHEKAYVLASVPGTQEARVALIEAAIPRTSVYSVSAKNQLEVPYAGDPSFVGIDGTDLRRAENTPFQVIMHNNFYYLCHDGAWYSSTEPQGPWRIATQVPEAIYTIPATDPFYNVTFVKLKSFDDSSGEVAYDKSSGYNRVYSNGYSLVYGTGWHHPGYIHHNPYGYNSYWRYPRSYGYGAWYNPYYGAYGYRGYYPQSYSATYNVNKRDKDWQWDLEGNKRQVYERGPRNYVGSGQYVMPDGTRMRDETPVASSAAGSYAASNNGEDDLYSGPNGEIYRKTQNGWQQSKNGSWQTADGSNLEYLDQQYLARQAGYQNYDEYRRQRNLSP